MYLVNIFYLLVKCCLLRSRIGFLLTMEEYRVLHCLQVSGTQILNFYQMNYICLLFSIEIIDDVEVYF